MSFSKEFSTKNEVEKKEPQLNSIRQVHDCLDTLIGMERCDSHEYADWYRNEKGFINNGIMYALISINNQDTPELIPIAHGRISHKTFKKGIFQQLPFDVYCVNYSKESWKDYEDKEKNPKKYLSKTIAFVANNGKIAPKPEIKDPIKAKNLITLLRNQIINIKTTPEEFSSFFQNLSDDIIKLGEYFQNPSTYFQGSEFESMPLKESMKKNAKIIRLRDTLWGIGINRFGVAVGERESMRSIINLKKEFDFNQHRFIE